MRILLLLLLFSFAGCSLLKAGETKHTVFLPSPKLLVKNNKRAPFHGYWVLDGNKLHQSLENSGEIYVPEIDFSHAVNLYLEARGDKRIKEERIEEIKELARYFREKIRLSFKSNQDFRVKFINKKSPNSLKMKVSLTSVIPTNPGVNFVGTLAGFFVPGGGLLKYFGSGSASIEGFTLDSNEKILLEQFKDREGHKTYPFTLKDFQRYAHIRVVLDDWAMQIAELVNTPPEHKVKDSFPFSLRPF